MPQMTAQVVFVTAKADQALTVPLTAVRASDDGKSQTVRLLGSNQVPQERAVKLGVRSRHQVQVLQGLDEGDRLVVGESRSDGGLRWLQW
ncbi:Macrolide export protein MacA [compost metagenome]